MANGKRPDSRTTQLARALKQKFHRGVVVRALLGLPEDDPKVLNRITSVMNEATYMPLEWVPRVAEILDLDIASTVQTVSDEATERAKTTIKQRGDAAVQRLIDDALAAYPLTESVALGNKKTKPARALPQSGKKQQQPRVRH